VKVTTQFLLAISLLSSLVANDAPRPYFNNLITIQASRPDIPNLVKKLTEAESLSQIQAIVTEHQQLVSWDLAEAMLQTKEIDPLTSPADKIKVQRLNQTLLGLSQRVNHRKGIAVAINHLGIIHSQYSRYDLANEYHKHSLLLLTEPEDQLWLSKTYRIIGLNYYRQKNFSAMRAQYEANFELAKKGNVPYYLAQALYLLGVAYEENELFKEAIRYYEDSLAISRKIISPPSQANLPVLIRDTFIRSGRANLGAGQYKQAISNYEQVIDYWRQIPSSPDQESALASALNSLGYASFMAKQYPQAIESSTKSYEIALKLQKDDLLALASRVIALAHSAMGNHSEAVKMIIEARQFAEKEARKYPEKSEPKEIKRIVYGVEGIVRYAANQPEIARKSLEEAIKLTEQQQALVPLTLDAGPSSMGYPSSYYGWMVALMVSQNQPEEALKYSEMVKGRALYNLLYNPKDKDTGLIPKEDLVKRDQLTDKVLKLEIEISKRQFAALPDDTAIADLQLQFRETLESLAKVVKKIEQELQATSKNGIQAFNLNLKSLLHNDRTALLQFAITEEQAFLFVATKSAGEVELQAYSLILTNDQIEKKVKNFRSLIMGKDQTNDLGTASRELHDNLLGKAQAQLKNKTELIIVPDGPLWELPFQALKTADNHYLIEQAAISYVPSFGVLQKASQQQPDHSPKLDLLAFGNPFLAKRTGLTTSTGEAIEPLDNLQNAEFLVKKISQLHNPATSNVFIGKMATEEKFKALAPKYRIIFLASHGLFGSLDPMRSSIVLAQNGVKTPDDGFLEAREIARMHLSAEMVVLSACDSGRGQMREGEGIVGLPWAIFAAGCPTTVVSQWQVDSLATANLISSMYSKLGRNNKQATKAEALQKAAITMLNGSNKDFRHPYYWASFILFGKAN
jgi:CHAT domain-containing protein